MKVLIACEESQTVCKAFRELGHEAYSNDIIECSGGHPEWHLKMDCFDAFKMDKWDLIIAHPPCTHLSVSGQWAFSRGFKNIKLRDDAIDFFMRLVNLDQERIIIENPIGIMSTIYRKPDQIIQPYQFGDLAMKKTCLWLKNMPLLKIKTDEIPKMEFFEWIDGKTGKKKRMQKWMYDIRKMPVNQRSHLASKTFPGIAKAMAEQWGNL